MSTPWEGDLLYFPGGMRYRLEHKLGQTPRSWEAFLSFDEHGSRDETLAPAAGNQVELVGIDDVAITVRNGSCADYYLLITVSAGTD